MRRNILKCICFSAMLLGASVGVVGCGHPVQKQLEGRWLGDGVENFQDEHVAMATGWAKGVTFEFSQDVFSVSVPAEEARKGPYKIASVRGSNVRVSVKRPDGKYDTADLQLDDNYSMRWLLGEGRAVVLRKEP